MAVEIGPRDAHVEMVTPAEAEAEIEGPLTPCGYDARRVGAPS